MRDQYAGDVTDYLKFSFLRALTADDRRLGMAWYCVPGHDGRADGRHVEFQTQASWRSLDEEVYAQLAALPERSLAAIEQLSFWPPGTRFHRTPITRLEPGAWAREMVNAMDDAELVFLDPDNGLGRSRTKHARIEDLVALRRAGRAISLIQFPGRNRTHANQVRVLHELLQEAGFRAPLTITTCVMVASGKDRSIPRHRFFTIADGDEVLRARAEAFAARVNELAGATADCLAP